jgi:hypothetical protein
MAVRQRDASPKMLFDLFIRGVRILASDAGTGDVAGQLVQPER